MSESTDVNDDQSGRRGSRRAMRQAEREAEREAILTGQQPLLTRRELKRQREEAEALRAAVEAGEITAEEARALQDPTAEQPEVKVPDLATTGAHAAVQQADEQEGGSRRQEESAGWSAPGRFSRSDDWSAA